MSNLASFRESASSVGKLEEAHRCQSRSALATCSPESVLISFCFVLALVFTYRRTVARKGLHPSRAHAVSHVEEALGPLGTLEISTLTHTGENLVVVRMLTSRTDQIIWASYTGISFIDAWFKIHALTQLILNKHKFRGSCKYSMIFFFFFY